MGWFVALGIVTFLMALCSRAFGNPLWIVGALYLGGCAYVLITIALKVAGGSL